jgi:hypothetical protein
MNIPSQNAATASDTQFLSEPHRLGIVGSPENITTHSDSSLMDYFTLQIPATRSQSPLIQTSSASYPSNAHQTIVPRTPGIGTQVYPSAQSLGTLRSRPFSLRKDGGREWSVFSEIMGTNDDQSSSARGNVQRNRTETLRGLFAERSSPMHSGNATTPRTLPATPSYELHQSSMGMTTEPENEGSDTISHSSASSVETPGVVRTDTYRPSSENKSWLSRILPKLSPLQRNILKCCVAYFIGSLFTYSPLLSGLIADIKGGDPGERTPSPSGHMVATVYVDLISSIQRILIGLQCCIFQPSQNNRWHVRSGHILSYGSIVCGLHFLGKHVHVLVLRSPSWLGMACGLLGYPMDWFGYVRGGIYEDVDG